jgi:hypothetical protein
VALGVFDGKFMAAVRSALERANNDGSCFLSAGVNCLDVVDHDVGAAGFNSVQIVGRFEPVGVLVVFLGAEHDHAAVEGKLSVADGVIGARVNGMGREPEHAAKPINSGQGVAVAECGDDSGPGVFHETSYCGNLSTFLRMTGGRRLVLEISELALEIQELALEISPIITA